MPIERKEELKEMGFLDHLEELRSAIIAILAAWIGLSIVLWFFSGQLLDFLLAGTSLEKLYFTAPIEAFMIRTKLSFITGFLAAFPYMLFRVWSFVSPGLFSHEKRIVLPFIIPATLLFYTGVVFAYWVMIPVVVDFLVKFGTEMLSPLITADKYFGFVARLCLVFGLVFQLPLIIVLLTSLGLMSPSALLKQWRWVILIIFVVSAVLTPPDPASQLLMAIPLVVLFLVSSALSILIEKRKKAKKDREE